MNDALQSNPELKGFRTLGKLRINDVLMAVLANSSIINSSPNIFEALREGYNLIPEISFEPFKKEFSDLFQSIEDLVKATRVLGRLSKLTEEFKTDKPDGIYFSSFHEFQGAITTIIQKGCKLEISSEALIFHEGDTSIVLTNDYSGVNQIIVNNSQVCLINENSVLLRDGNSYEIERIKNLIREMSSMVRFGIDDLKNVSWMFSTYSD